MDLYAKRIFSIDTENAFKIVPHIKQVESNGHIVIKLNLGEPDFTVPEVVKEEIKRQLDLNNTHYCDPKGILGLRVAIAEQILRSRNLNVSPEQIVVFPGAKPGIGFSQQVYCNPGDDIIYPSPGFPIFESFIRYWGGDPVPAHLTLENNFTLTADHLSELITPKTKMIFLNYPANPTGNIANKQELEKMADIILSKCHKEVRVYSDEVYERIIFEDQVHHSIASIPDMEKRTIISSGFSKSYAWTGGRVGYAIFPSVEEADIVKDLNINYFSCIAPYHQEAARVALSHPEAETTVLKMVATFQKRRDYIVAALNKIPGVTCNLPNGAFYVFPNIQGLCERLGVLDAYQNLDPSIQSQTSPSTLFQMFALFHHYVAVMDRRSFGKIGSENQHYIRISYASDITLLEEGIARLTKAAQDENGFKQFMMQQKHLF